MTGIIVFLICLIVGLVCCIKGKLKNNAVLLIAGIGLVAIGAIVLMASWLATLGILLCAAGLILLLTAGQKNRLAAIAACAVILGGIAALLGSQRASDGNAAHAIDRFLEQSYVQGAVLGEYVRKNYSGKTVGVLIPAAATERMAEQQEQMLAGFRDGLGRDADKVIRREKFDPEKILEGEEDLPLMQRFLRYSSGARFDSLFESVACEVILNMAGSPAPAEEIRECAAMSSGEKVLIFPENELNHSSRLYEFIKNGNIGALVIPSANAVSFRNSLPEGNAQVKFDSVYKLITPENIDVYVNKPEYRSVLTEQTDDGDSED